MRTLAIICYLVGACAEGGATVLVVLEVRQSRRAMRAWVAANPMQNSEGSWGQQLVLNDVVIGLLGSTWRRGLAVALVSIGIVAGAIGNFASLPNR